MVFEFFLVLQVLSWHNMIRPTQDLSTWMSIFNIIAMTAFLAYLFYIFFRFKNEKRAQIKENFGWIYKIHRLKRGKSHKMIYLLWYLSRRVVLALVFVFMNNQDYAPV
jgi:hypothetical protein